MSNFFSTFPSKLDRRISTILKADGEKQEKLITDLRDQLTDLLKYKSNTFTLQEELNKLMAEKDAEIDRLNKSTQDLSLLNSRLRDERNQVQDQAKNMQKQFDEIQKEISNSQIMSSNLQKEYEKLQREHRALKRSFQKQLQENKKLADDAEQKEQLIIHLNSQNQLLENEKRSLENENRKNFNDKIQLNNDLSIIQEMFKHILSGDQRKFDEMQRSQILSNPDLQKDLGSIKNRISHLSRTNRNLENDLGIAQKQINELKSTESFLSSQISTKEKENQKLMQGIHILVRALIPLQEKIRSLSTQKQYYQIIEKELEKYKDMVRDLKYQLTGRRYSGFESKPVSLRNFALVALFGKKLFKSIKTNNRKIGNQFFVEGSIDKIHLAPQDYSLKGFPFSLIRTEGNYPINETLDVENFVSLITYYYPNFFVKPISVQKAHQLGIDPSTYETLFFSVEPHSPSDKILFSVKNNIGQLMNQLRKEQEEKILLVGKIDDLKQDNTRKNDDILNLEDSLRKSSDLSRRLQMEVDQLQEQRKSLVPISQLNRVQDELESQKMQNNLTANLLQKAQKDVDDKATELQNLSMMLNESNKEKRRLNRLINQTDKENETLKDSITHLQQQLNETESLADFNKTEIKRLNSLLQDLQEKNDSLNLQHNQLRREISAYKKHILMLKKEIQTLIEKDVDFQY